MPDPPLLALLCTVLMVTNEHLWPCQLQPQLQPPPESGGGHTVSSFSGAVYPLPASNSNPSGSLAQPKPTWPQPLTTLLGVQALVGLACLACLTPTSTLTLLAGPLLLLAALRRLPTPRLLLLTLPYTTLLLLSVTLTLASSLPRGALYTSLGLPQPRLRLAQALQALYLALSLTTLPLLLIRLNAVREGQSVLRSVGLEMGDLGIPPTVTNSNGSQAFQGTGRTLGVRQTQGGVGLAVGVGSGRRTSTPPKNRPRSGEAGKRGGVGVIREEVAEEGEGVRLLGEQGGADSRNVMVL